MQPCLPIENLASIYPTNGGQFLPVFPFDISRPKVSNIYNEQNPPSKNTKIGTSRHIKSKIGGHLEKTGRYPSSWIAIRRKKRYYRKWTDNEYLSIDGYHESGNISNEESIIVHHPDIALPHRTMKRHWTDIGSRREFFDWLADDIGLDSSDLWYGVGYDEIDMRGGAGLLTHKYDSSVAKALMHVYPDTQWHMWRFHSVPDGFWNDLSNQREYFHWLADQLEVNCAEDWYRIALVDIVQRDGCGLLKIHYGGSPAEALMTVFPELPWQPWCFQSAPSAFWLERKHHRDYFDWLAEQLKINHMDDWNHVKNVDVIENHGAGLMAMYYDNSPSKALPIVFPDTTWHPWQFARVPANYWNDTTNCAQYLRWLEAQLSITSPSNWYGVTAQLIARHDGGTVVDTRRSLMGLLQLCYPSEEWQANKWVLSHRSKIQQFLHTCLPSLFPERTEIEQEAQIMRSLFKFQKTHVNIVFDAWLPALNVALEYQGAQHFMEVPFLHQGDLSLARQYTNDREKQEMCASNGITLIKVPYWWDYAIDQLAGEIFVKHGIKEVCQSIGCGSSFPESLPCIPMKSALFPYDDELFEPSKGYNWNYSMETTSRWASIKHNGVRIISDGKGTFHSKQGTKVILPSEYRNLLSIGFPLEFELCFEETDGPHAASCLIHRRNSETPTWWGAILYVFDAPRCHGDIHERLQRAKWHLPTHPNIKFVNHHKIHEELQLVNLLSDPQHIHDIENWDIEGLMLHSSHTPYIQGRHSSVLKLKVRLVEYGRVIGYHPHRCVLHVNLANNMQVWVHSRCNYKRMTANFPIGSQVSVYYYEKHASGIPRNATLCKWQSTYVLP